MKKETMRLFGCLLCILVCTTVSGQQPGVYHNPVIPGDLADPTVVRIGDAYYASGTSSEWAPFYPMFMSKDLVNWTQTGHIFDKRPEWTLSSFWAPELFWYQNKLYAYYTARNKKGVSYIGVATAEGPAGPFTDHGLVVDLGTEAIDAFILEDKGKLYISWKAYGLDKRPIELLACQLSDDGLRLVGTPFSLMKDEENIGMEGQHWLKKGEYYYIIYSVKGCCGPGSDYQVYVSRSKNLRGPYEKYSGNPILYGDGKEVLSCGHGTVTSTPDGRMYYLFHAYLTGERFFGGRQAMLQELYIGDDHWIHFTTGNVATLEQKMPFSGVVQQPVMDFVDDFRSPALSDKWVWNYPYATLKANIGDGELSLSGISNEKGGGETVLCLRPVSPHYAYETKITNRNGSFKGLTMYGDTQNLLAFGCVGDRLMVKVLRDGKESVLSDIPTSDFLPYLKIEVNGGSLCSFFRSIDGEIWEKMEGVADVIDVDYLVRWDRVARPGLIHIGEESSPARFSHFYLKLMPSQTVGTRVLFIGDSITDGNWGGGGAKPSADRNHWDKNHIFGSGFMYLCAAHYMGDFPEKEYEFFNRGISGHTLNDLEKRWNTDVIEMKPDVLSVLVGINDIGKYIRDKEAVPFDFETWESKYRTLLDNVRISNPEVKIVLGAPFITLTGTMRKSTHFEEQNKMVRQCAAIVRTIARDYQAVYLPFHEMFDDILKTTPTSQDAYWVWDGIHPTPAGHQRMAELWMSEVDKAEICK